MARKPARCPSSRPPSQLGLKGRKQFFETEIVKAFEDAVRAVPGEGFSQQTLRGREDLLRQAKDAMVENGGRVGSRYVSVPWDLLPAALVILTDIGEWDLVVEVGTRVLKSRQIVNAKRDILLAIALSHCTFAQETLLHSDKVALGCARLEEALAVLRSAGEPVLSPDLVSQVEDALAKLIPHSLLEQLADPVSAETLEARCQTLEIVATLLEDPASAPVGDDGMSIVTPQFARIATGRLTGEELIGITDWEAIARKPAGCPWAFQGMMTRVVQSLICLGFAKRRPELIREAEVFSRKCGWESRMEVERAMCRILLGDVDDSLAILSSAESRAPSKATSSLRQASSWSMDGETGDKIATPGDAMAFVRANSPGPDDLLPGLCALTESWIADAAAKFRDLEGVNPSLDDYFEDRHVAKNISLGDRSGPVDMLSSALSEAREALSHMLSDGTPSDARSSRVPSPNVPADGSLATSPAGAPAQRDWNVDREMTVAEATASADAGTGFWAESSVEEMLQRARPAYDSYGGPAGTSGASDGVTGYDYDPTAAYSAGASPYGGQVAIIRPQPPAAIVPAEEQGPTKLETVVPPSSFDSGRDKSEVKRSSWLPWGRNKSAGAEVEGVPFVSRYASSRAPPPRPPGDDAEGPYSPAAIVPRGGSLSSAIYQDRARRKGLWVDFVDRVSQAVVLAGCVYAGSRVAGRMRIVPRAQAAVRDVSIVVGDAVKSITGRHLPGAPFPLGGSRSAERKLRGEVERTIARWQEVKRNAFGPDGSTEGMSDVLAGDFLETWRQRYTELATGEWFWKYELRNLEVRSIKVGPDGGVQVDVEVDETGELWNTYGQTGDSYSGPYFIRYTLVPNDSLSAGALPWKITMGSLL